MNQVIICLLTLLFPLSSPAMEGNADFWQSFFAAKGGANYAEGAHTVFRRNPVTGKVTHYETRIPQTNPRNPNPWQVEKRVDVVGDPHFNKVLNQDVPTPHVHDPTTPGGVRPALPGELPR